MITSIEFPRIYVDKDLSTLSPKDYLVYQVDIRCLRREDFKTKLHTFYSQDSVRVELEEQYKTEVSNKVSIDNLITNRISEELILFDKIVLQVIVNNPSDNLFSLVLEKDRWETFKEHIMWGSLFGTYYNLIGSKINFGIHQLLVVLVLFLGFTLLNTETISTKLLLPFVVLGTYLVLKAITLYCLFKILRVPKAIEKLLQRGFLLSSSREFLTLDVTVLTAGVVLSLRYWVQIGF